MNEQENLSTENTVGETVDAITEAPAPTVEAGNAPQDNSVVTAEPAAADTSAFLPMPVCSAEEPAAKRSKGVKMKPCRRYKKRRLKRPRPLRRFLRFLLILLLGMLVGYASIAGAVYYAVAYLTIDDLQKLGIAEGADEVLTESGEVDLTATSILDFLKDLEGIRSELSAYSINSLIARYGVVLPEETLAKLPQKLLGIPLSEFAEGDALSVVTENISCGYLLSFLPDGMLNAHMLDAIKDRPLSLLMEGKYGDLLAGVKLGYLTGVEFDGAGNVVYRDPDFPTSQECFALLDLGHLIGAITQNEDIMAVLATDLGDQDVAPILTGFMSGALFEKMCEGNKIADVLVADPETGRYAFSLTALTENVYLGDALGYTLADGVWYSVYTDNGDATDDTAVSTMEKTLAGIKLSEVIGGTLSLDATFDGLYLGDLQAGYVRGDAITESDPVGGETRVTGYVWYKDGAVVSKMQSKIANVAVNDLFNGGLDVTAVLGELFIGDLQGYTLLDGHWYRSVAGGTEYVGAVQNAIAGICLADVLNGNLDIVSTLSTLSLGDVQGYTLKSDGWHRSVAGGTEYVGAVQNAVANVKLADILEGKFSISDALSELLLGDAMGYTRGEILTPADPADPASYDKYNFTKAGDTAVAGAMLEIANLKLSDVLDGKADFESTVKNIPLGDILEYTCYKGVWYESFVAEDHADNKPAKGVLAVLADFTVNEITTENINKIEMGEILGYAPVDSDADGIRDGWKNGDKTVSGMMLVIADLSVGTLSNDSGLMSALRGITLGDALGYTKDGDTWYVDEQKSAKVTGVIKALADRPISAINEQVINEIKLGDAIGYTYNTDEARWYDGENLVTGAMANMSGLTLGQLRNQTDVVDKIGEMQLATVLDYEWDGDEWICRKTARPATGMLEYLLPMQINGIEAHTSDMPLGYAFGYHRVNGQWSTQVDSVVSPTGITAVLVDVQLCDAAETLNTMPLGQLLGHTKQNGTWYEKYVAEGSASNKKLSGITLAFADLSVSELGNATALSAAMQDVMLGEAMGYTKEDGIWYQGSGTEKTAATGILAALADSKLSEIEHDVADLPIGTLLGFKKDGSVWKDAESKTVTGVLGAIADCKANELEETLNTMKVGTLLGFTKSGAGWKDGAEAPVTGLLATISDTSVRDLPARMNGLTVGDVFAEDERTGVLAVVPATTPIAEIGDAVFECSVAELVTAGVLKPIDPGKDALISGIVGSGWKSMPLADFMDALFGPSHNP